MKFTIARSNGTGYDRTEVRTFNDGTVHSMAGVHSLQSSQLRDEASILRYAKDNNLTIKFGR